MSRGAHKKKENAVDIFSAPSVAVVAEADPVVRLAALVNLQEISRCEQSSTRILRCNRSGISVYVHSLSHNWRQAKQCRYIVAYEGEVDAAVHVKQILIQSNDATSVLEVLKLIERYAWALYEKLYTLPRMTRYPLPESLEKIGGFHLKRTRKSIKKLLAPLTGAHLTKEAYQGFINAVISLTS